MKMFKRLLFIIVFTLVLTAMMKSLPAAGKEYHMKLLAVTETTNEPSGMIADIYLEIKPGSGHIYMDTFPLTKLDTQISTRFANSIACNYLNTDCHNRDFFYTIRSNSVIVGGPSAGGAITLLTIAALKDYDIDESIAITGTINSGGLIGPVGGLRPKIEAAARFNLSTVLIPQGERFITEMSNSSNKSNTTIDLYDFGRQNAINIREVATIDDVVFEFTGKRLWEDSDNITINSEYENIMSTLAHMLCDRSDELKKSIGFSNSTIYRSALNLTGKAKTALEHEKYYSAASFCFGANIKFNNDFLIKENNTKEGLEDLIHKYQSRIIVLDRKTESREQKSLNDLEAYEVVKERLTEAEDHLKESAQYLEKNSTQLAIYFLSFGIERYNSALSWSSFFNAAGKEVELNQQSIKDSCIQKLSEAQERYQYVQLYMPLRLQDTKKEIDRAHKNRDEGNYQLCLFKATKAKAEADTVLGALGIPDDKIDSYLDIKLRLVRQQIVRQQQEGYFPILGYSYYEYADNLKDTDKYSALLYSEYALELSNLDIYFTKAKSRGFSLPAYPLLMFGLGALFGSMLVLLLKIQPKKQKQVNIRIRKR